MNFEIISVGTELLLGQIVNTNAQAISRMLSELGMNVYYTTVVGDNPERLRAALEIAASRADGIITTGGLGPTGDDLTKETIADFCGLPCEMHAESLKRLKARFAAGKNPMPENNLKQVMMPKGCVVLDNDHGTAPGAVIEHGNNTFIMLPGPPHEMEAMLKEKVRPYLKAKTDSVIDSKTLRVFGIGESAVEERLQELMRSQSNPTLAPYAKTGEVELRLTAKAENTEKAEAMLMPLEKAVRDALGDAVYAEGEDGNLQKTVVSMLLSRGLTLATAESCTGGLIAKKITEVAGASACFQTGFVTYANETKEKLLDVSHDILKEYGAVSEQTALAMSLGARKRSGSDIGVGVTGIAGPGGGTEEKPVGLVYISISAKDFHQSYRLLLTGGRDMVRERAAMHVLDMVRRYLLER